MTNKENKILLTVIVTTFNHELFIEKTVNAILNQKTNYSYEVIVADDCSTDNSQLLLRKIYGKSKYLRLILNNQNLGSQNNFFNAVKLAKGRYIANCDGDDIWNDEYKIQKQLNFMLNDKSVVMTYHNADIIDESNRIIKNSRLSKNFKGHDDESLILGALVPSSSIMMIKTDLIRISSIETLSLNLDSLLVAYYAQKGTIKYLSSIKPILYREHVNSMWNTLDERSKLNNRILYYIDLLQIDIKVRQKYTVKHQLIKLYFKSFLSYNNLPFLVRLSPKIVKSIFS
ncbi:MAG: glycosyltransferase [Cyclobacteriaceae bacterium]|nr:glycosyltransferase [Cyclobacteriaceae bacterium]MCH8515117.1 glycosyltransferase [Cyclobacteriaceae bacterium]